MPRSQSTTLRDLLRRLNRERRADDSAMDRFGGLLETFEAAAKALLLHYGEAPDLDVHNPARSPKSKHGTIASGGSEDFVVRDILTNEYATNGEIRHRGGGELLAIFTGWDDNTWTEPIDAGTAIETNGTVYRRLTLQNVGSKPAYYVVKMR